MGGYNEGDAGYPIKGTTAEVGEETPVRSIGSNQLRAINEGRYEPLSREETDAIYSPLRLSDDGTVPSRLDNSLTGQALWPLQWENIPAALASDQSSFDRYQSRYRLKRGYPLCSTISDSEGRRDWNGDVATCWEESGSLLQPWEEFLVPRGICDGESTCMIPKSFQERAKRQMELSQIRIAD